VDVLIRFQFDDREPSRTSDGKQIEDAMFTPGVCKNLGINELFIEDGIHARDVLTNKAFQPAFWLSAVKRVPRVAGQRVAMIFQIFQESLEGGARSCRKFLARIVDSEKDASCVPAGEGKPAKAQPHFAGLGRGMQSYRPGSRGDDGFELGPRLMERSEERRVGKECRSRWSPYH